MTCTCSATGRAVLHSRPCPAQLAAPFRPGTTFGDASGPGRAVVVAAEGADGYVACVRLRTGRPFQLSGIVLQMFLEEEAYARLLGETV